MSELLRDLKGDQNGVTLRLGRLLGLGKESTFIEYLEKPQETSQSLGPWLDERSECAVLGGVLDEKDRIVIGLVRRGEQRALEGGGQDPMSAGDGLNLRGLHLNNINQS